MGLAQTKASRNEETKDKGIGDVNDDPKDKQFFTMPSAKVQNIYIDGVSRSRSKMITRQLENLFKADTFERVVEEAHLGKLRLERLGVLQGSEVFIDVSRGEEADPRGLDVYYVIKEKKKFSASTGTELGNNEGSLSFKCNVNNIGGNGEALNVTASYGTSSASSYELGLSRPLFYNPDIRVQAGCFQKARDLIYSSYRESCSGSTASVSIPSPVGVHVISWDGVWRENRAMLPLVPFGIREQFGHSLKSSIKHVFTSDGRDSWFFPSHGHLFKHSVEYAGLGGNARFIKSEAEIQLNKEIIEGIVIGSTFQVGAMKSLGGKQSSINDRFFLGGPLTVRGFLFNGIGPRVETSALGADAYWASGLHLYTPLPFKPGQGGFGELFRTHLFLSAGNMCNIDFANPSADAFKAPLSNIRWSYGAGLIFLLGGIARLEVNYCVPKGSQPGDGLNPGLQIGLGMNFL